MKQDPDDAGYTFWLGKLNQFSGNFVNAEMVLAIYLFIRVPRSLGLSQVTRAMASWASPQSNYEQTLRLTDL